MIPSPWYYKPYITLKMTINLHYHLGRLSQKPWNRAYVTGDGEHVVRDDGLDRKSQESKSANYWNTKWQAHNSNVLSSRVTSSMLTVNQNLTLYFLYYFVKRNYFCLSYNCFMISNLIDYIKIRYKRISSYPVYSRHY